jgi:hypothetical protein
MRRRGCDEKKGGGVASGLRTIGEVEEALADG